MKAKITSKKILSLALSVVMLLSVIGVGFMAGAACEHTSLNESDWEIVRDTTCSMSGLKTQWCYDCGTEVEREIPIDPDAHVSGKWETVKAHTCQQTGLEAIYCTECKTKLQERVVPAHDYEVLYQQMPTCQAGGYRVTACLTCYDIKTENLEKDAEAHDFTEWQITTEATCVTESGVRKRYCINRDENGVQCTVVETQNYTDAENHTDIKWLEDEKVAPTCNAPGYIPGVCEDCGEEVRKDLAQHSESGFKVLSTTPSTCSTHGIERRECECGLEYDYELPIVEENHVYSDWQIRKEASCTPGERYKFCKYHYDVQLTEEIPANGEHSYGEWETVIEADCSKTGLDKKVCADCGNEVTRELPTKHDFATWKTVSEMSCNEKNLKNGTKIAKCDKCTYEKYFTIPSVHSFSAWRIVAPASCKNIDIAGTMQRTCTGCGKVESKTYYAEHDFTDWYATGKPVCAADGKSGRTGTYTRWCRNCNVIEHKNIPVTHEFANWEIVTYPKCNANGSVESGIRIGYCLFCDETKTETIEGEHIYGEWETVTAGTCSSEGRRQKECVVCGNIKTEAIPVAHSYGNWYADGGIKCGSGSALLTRKCADCGVTESATVPLNHPNKKTVTTKATCSTSGYTKESCPDCGYSEFIGEIIPATGHTLDANWSSKHQATCDTEGSRYKACANCDYLEFQYVARTEHILIELEPGVAPTCTEGGYSPVTFCTVCHKTFDSVALDKLGHEYAEGSEICSRCKAYDGSRDCTCSCHSSSGIEKIFFELINKLYQFFGINQECICGDLHYDEPGLFAKLFGKG